MEQAQPPVVTAEELRMITPRSMITLAARAGWRVQPLLKNAFDAFGIHYLHGSPLALAADFCAGENGKFETAWRAIALVGANDEMFEAMGFEDEDKPVQDEFQVILDIGYAAYALLYDCAEAIEAAEVESPMSDLVSTKPLEYPYEEFGPEKAIDLVVSLIDKSVYLIEKAAKEFEEEHSAAIHKVAKQEAKEITKEQSIILGRARNEALQMTDIVRKEIRREYEILLSLQGELQMEGEPLGRPIVFGETKLFGPLWSKQEPVWYEDYLKTEREIRIKREPVMTQEELEKLSPRSLVMLIIRCAQRIEPLVDRFKLNGEPLFLATEFCAGRVNRFEEIWNNINVHYVRYRALHPIFSMSATSAMLSPGYAAYALHYQDIEEKQETSRTRYPYDEVGVVTVLKIAADTILSVIDAAKEASKFMLEAPCAKDAFEAADNRHKAEPASPEMYKQARLEAEQMHQTMKKEIQRDYRILLLRQESLGEESDSLGQVYDFETEDLFGGLWSGEPPLWFHY